MRLTVGLRFRKVVRLELPRAFQKADSEKNGAVVGNIFDVRRPQGAVRAVLLAEIGAFCHV